MGTCGIEAAAPRRRSRITRCDSTTRLEAGEERIERDHSASDDGQLQLFFKVSGIVHCLSFLPRNCRLATTTAAADPQPGF